jgi:outer membrane immunogenic protein
MRSSKFIGLAAIAVSTVLGMGAAYAADLPVKAPPTAPPQIYSWTGFYAGLNAGGEWFGSSSVSTTSVPIFNAGFGGAQPFQGTITTLSNFTSRVGNAAGFIGGGQIGYNWQFNSWLVGLESDIQGVAGARGSATTSGSLLIPGFAQSTTQTASVSRSLDYLGTVRGRIGFIAQPTFLAYATGGFAYGGERSSTNILQALVPNSIDTPFWSGTGAFSSTRVGWTAGAGGEWMFASNWSAKLEYLYYDLGRVTYGVSPLVTVAGGAAFTVNTLSSFARFNGNIVRAGINYHFNWGSPVVARY